MTALGAAPSFTRWTASRRIVSEVSCDSVRPSMRTPLHSTGRSKVCRLNKGLVSKSGVALGLRMPADIRGAVSTAHQELFNQARLLVRDEVPGTEYSNIAMATVDERRTIMWEHLERRIELQILETTQSRPTKEFDQKFRILLSPRQAERDFDAWGEVARTLSNLIA